jgi:hypothetical protein
MKKLLLISLAFLLFTPLIRVGAEGEGSMVVISPNESGLIYELGDTITIEWEQENMNWVNIRIKGEQCSGNLVVDYNPITAESGTYEWTIPDDFYCLGEDVYFSLTGYNDSDGYIDYTSNAFQIISTEEKVSKFNYDFESVVDTTLNGGETDVHLGNIVFKSYYTGYTNLTSITLDDFDINFTVMGRQSLSGNVSLVDTDTGQELCSVNPYHNFIGAGSSPDISMNRANCEANLTILGGQTKTFKVMGDIGYPQFWVQDQSGNAWVKIILFADKLNFSGTEPSKITPWEVTSPTDPIYILANIDNDTDEVDYPGFDISLDKASYSTDDRAYFTLSSIINTGGVYRVDLYGQKNVVGGDVEQFLLKSDIPVSYYNPSTLTFSLSEFEADDDQGYEYSLLVCSSENGCVEGYTNAGAINIEQSDDDDEDSDEPEEDDQTECIGGTNDDQTECIGDDSDDDNDNNNDNHNNDIDDDDLNVDNRNQNRRQINTQLTNRMRGRILLQVENHGEAWYVRPDNGRRIYMKDGAAAYGMMRDLGLGISNADLEKIPVGVEGRFECLDSDGDGLCNKLEEGLGTDPNDDDSDDDGYKDGTEVKSGYNPKGLGNMIHNNTLVNSLKGKIVLQVESRGEAWYINPDDGKRYYMTDGPAAYQIMRFLSLGITNADLAGLEMADETLSDLMKQGELSCNSSQDCVDYGVGCSVNYEPMCIGSPISYKNSCICGKPGLDY